ATLAGASVAAEDGVELAGDRGRELGLEEGDDGVDGAAGVVGGDAGAGHDLLDELFHKNWPRRRSMRSGGGDGQPGPTTIGGSMRRGQVSGCGSSGMTLAWPGPAPRTLRQRRGTRGMPIG